jgi:hypothetical protein
MRLAAYFHANINVIQIFNHNGQRLTFRKLFFDLNQRES